MNDYRQLAIRYLKNNKKIGIDIKKNLSGLRYRKIEIDNFTFDLLLAIYLLDPKVSEEPSSLFNYLNIINFLLNNN